MDATVISPPARPTAPSALGAVSARCDCGRDGCEETFAITPRQLARVRSRGHALVVHRHLASPNDVVGVADGFLVVARLAPVGTR